MQHRVYRFRAPEHPVLQFLAVVMTAVVAIGAIFLGAIVLTFLIGLAVIAGLVLYIRLWWLRRRQGPRGPAAPGRPTEIVEVEYTVVEERSLSDDRAKRSED